MNSENGFCAGDHLEQQVIRGRIPYYYHPKEKSPFFSNVGFDFSTGRISCIIGQSGVGKSTLMRVILSESEGRGKCDIQLQCNSEVLTPIEAKLRGYIGYCATDLPLIPWMDVKSNLKIPAQLNPHLITPSDSDVNQALSSVGLQNRHAELKPHEASFGMMQRIMLARVLLYKPSFLFLHEPFAGLDEENTSFVAERVDRYVKDSSATCLMVTHNLSHAAVIGDDVYFMDFNRNLFRLEAGVSERTLRERLKKDIEFSLGLRD